MREPRPLALVTGASRRQGIAAAIVVRLARAGWDIAAARWPAYDAQRPWGADEVGAAAILKDARAAGASTTVVEADLSDPAAAEFIVATAERELGAVRALILSHCESVESSILETTIESFDRHMAVNARAPWLLIRAFVNRFRGPDGCGRILALTSDDTAGNLPYGASKGALDRIVLAAAREFASRGITANVIDPGATDTGWMTEAQRREFAQSNPLGRLGTPEDCAHLVAFLCSVEGGWINGQLIRSNGGVG